MNNKADTRLACRRSLALVIVAAGSTNLCQRVRLPRREESDKEVEEELPFFKMYLAF